MGLVTPTRVDSSLERPLPLRLTLPLCILAGIFYFASFPGIGLWPLGFVALVPLLISLRNQSIVVAALLGLACGTTATSLGFSWLIDTFRHHGGFGTLTAAVLLLILSVLQAGRFALFAALVRGLHRRAWPWTACVAGAFVTSETIYPLIFPWYFGAVVHDIPFLLQTADLGGPVLVGLPLVLVNAACADVFRASKPQFPSKSAWGTAALMLAGTVIYGAFLIVWTDHRTQSAPLFRVGLVQGNVPMPPASSEQLAQKFRTQVELSRRLIAEGAQLVVWPESAFLHVLASSDPASLVARTEAATLEAPLLTGAILESHDGKLFNSALLLGPDGQLRGRYDKQHRLAFGEYLPFGETFPILSRWSPQSGSISKGIASGPLAFESRRISVLLCYEDILPSYVREVVQTHRPHLLVNLTNDGWFGRSRAAVIHLALAKLRAVEHRRYLLRATNTAMSAVIDPVGRQQAVLEPFIENTYIGDLRWLHGWTLYGFWGEFPWYCVAIGTLGGCVLRRGGRGLHSFWDKKRVNSE